MWWPNQSLPFDASWGGEEGRPAWRNRALCREGPLLSSCPQTSLHPSPREVKSGPSLSQREITECPACTSCWATLGRGAAGQVAGSGHGGRPPPGPAETVWPEPHPSPIPEQQLPSPGHQGHVLAARTRHPVGCSHCPHPALGTLPMALGCTTSEAAKTKETGPQQQLCQAHSWIQEGRFPRTQAEAAWWTRWPGIRPSSRSTRQGD